MDDSVNKRDGSLIKQTRVDEPIERMAKDLEKAAAMIREHINAPATLRGILSSYGLAGAFAPQLIAIENGMDEFREVARENSGLYLTSKKGLL